MSINMGNLFSEKVGGMVALSNQEFYEPHGLAVVRQGGVAAIPPDDLKKILRGVDLDSRSSQLGRIYGHHQAIIGAS